MSSPLAFVIEYLSADVAYVRPSIQFTNIFCLIKPAHIRFLQCCFYNCNRRMTIVWSWKEKNNKVEPRGVASVYAQKRSMWVQCAYTFEPFYQFWCFFGDKCTKRVRESEITENPILAGFVLILVSPLTPFEDVSPINTKRIRAWSNTIFIN